MRKDAAVRTSFAPSSFITDAARRIVSPLSQVSSTRRTRRPAGLSVGRDTSAGASPTRRRVSATEAKSTRRMAEITAPGMTPALAMPTTRSGS